MTQEEILQKAKEFGRQAREYHKVETDSTEESEVREQKLTNVIVEFTEFNRTIKDHFLRIAAGREFHKARFE